MQKIREQSEKTCSLCGGYISRSNVTHTGKDKRTYCSHCWEKVKDKMEHEYSKKGIVSRLKRSFYTPESFVSESKKLYEELLHEYSDEDDPEFYDDDTTIEFSDKILFWVDDEKLDELLHSNFSPGYEGDYYTLSELDWQKFQEEASDNGFEKEEDYDIAYDLSNTK